MSMEVEIQALVRKTLKKTLNQIIALLLLGIYIESAIIFTLRLHSYTSEIGVISW